MPSLPADLDKSGSPYNWLRTWIGPSIGWKMLPENLPQVYDILDYGGIGDDATDNSAALAAATAAMKAAGGGVVFFPPGIFQCSQPLTLNQVHGMGIIGSGRSFQGNKGTILKYTGNGNFITVTNSNGFRIEQLQITSLNVKTSGYDITFSGCGRCRLSELLLLSGYSGIHLVGNNGTYLDRIDIGYNFGPSGIFQDGDAIVFVQNIVCSTQPIFDITSVKTWAITTAFTQGDLVFTNGNLYQCSQSGTSAGSGTGPSGITGFDPFTTPIQDGTAQWFFLHNGDLTWYRFGNGSQTCTIMNSEFLWGVYGFRSQDVNSNFVFLFDVETEASVTYGTYLQGGGLFEASSCYFSFSYGVGLEIGAGYGGTVTLGQTEMLGNHNMGLDIHADNVFVNGCIIKNSPTNNVFISGSNVGINNCQISGSAGNGINIDAAADNLYIAGNDLTGNGTAILDNSADTNIVIRDNRGRNPVGASTISASASPFSYRAGHSPETVYLSASTSITALTINGNSILPSSVGANVNFTLQLEPNELAVITYTGSLTAKKMIH